MSGRRLRVACGVLFAALLGGCVSVPISGPIEPVPGAQPACQNCVNVEVAPPGPDDDPKQIVEGFLRATSNFQPSYSVARQFLSKTSRDTWSPDQGAVIYQGSVSGAGSEVTLTGRAIGSLDRDRTYTGARTPRLRVGFKLVKEAAGWRIDNPKAGLFVSKYAFDNSYRPYTLYFLAGNGAALVPEPIHLPSLSSPQNVASALISALLDGPSDWLAPAVASIPAGTTLNASSVTITDGLADVPLSGNLLALTDADRSRFAAQVVFTLAEAGLGVKSVSISVNGVKLRIPEADPAGGVIPVDAVPHELDPVPFSAGEQLYLVGRNGRAYAVYDPGQKSGRQPVPNAFGRAGARIDSLAVSVANTDLAAVTRNRTRLVRAPTKDGPATTLIRGASGLLRPQFTRNGEVWTIGRQGGTQRLWVFGGPKREEVAAPLLGQGRVQAFRVSPDGVRVAMIRRSGGATQLGLARISRRGVVRVDGWQPLDLRHGDGDLLTRITDVGWLNATDLVVLAADVHGGAVAPYRVPLDASEVDSLSGGSDNWDPKEVSVQLPTQTVLVRGSGATAWRDDGSTWLPFLNGVAALAFPG